MMGILIGSFVKMFGVIIMIAMINVSTLQVDSTERETMLKTIRDQSYGYEGEEQKTKFFENETNVFCFVFYGIEGGR